MADIQEILGKQINSVKELKATIKELQDSLVGVDAESEQFKTTSEQLTAAQAELVKVTKAGTQENNAAKDSIIGMKQEYKALYDQYKLLSDEQRNSDFGKNMAASLETLSSKINETQKGVGSFKDNIGNYAGSISDAFNKMGVSVGALKGPLDTAKVASGGLNTAFKTLAANPIMLAITAIVAILAKAAAAIKNNEELTQRLHQAMATFKPILDAVSNAFDFLAGIIVKVVEGFAKFSAKVLSIIPGMKQAIKSHQDLAKATDELTKKQRENEVVNSQKQADIERLREEASATDDVIEKQRLLQEAKEKQAEIDQANIEIAQEELRILQEYSEKTANSAEENEKLAAAQKKVNDAIAQGERNQRMYNKQLDATTSKTNTAASSTKNYREEAKKLYEQTVENSKTEITKLTEKYEKEKKLLVKYGYDTTLLTRQYEKEKSDIYQANANAEYNKLLSNYEKELDAKNRHLDNMAKLDKKGFETRVEQLTKLQYALKGLETWWNTVSNESSLFADFYKEGNWSSIPESFKDFPEVLEGLHTQLIDLNKTYGITIENTTDLKDNIELAGQAILDFWEDYTVATIEKRLDDFDWTSIKEELDMMIGGFDPSAIAVEKARNSAEYLELEKQILQEELTYWYGSYEKKVELTKRLYEVQEELLNRQAELEALNQQRSAEMVESLIDAADRMTSALGTWKQTRESLIDSEVKAGKISEAEAAKQKKRLLTLERLERDFAIATIVADAASAGFKIWQGYANEVGLINPQTAAAAGPGAAAALAALNTKSLISAIAKTAGLAATATAQIAAAQGKYVTAKNNMSADEGGGSTGVAAAPMLIDSTPYSYTRTVQTAEEEDAINNRPLWVSVVDIEDALGHQAEVKDESSF